MNGGVNFDSTHQIIVGVEGKTEELLFKAFIDKRFRKEKDLFKMVNYGGRDNLSNWLKTVFGAGNPANLWQPGSNKILALIVDRDEHTDDARLLQKIDADFNGVSLPTPESFDTLAGSWIESPYAATAVKVFPGSGKGAIESFLLEHAKNPQDVDCSKAYLKCIDRECSTQSQKDKVISEATWIASLIRAGAKESHQSFYSSFADSFSTSGNRGPWDFEDIKEELSPFFQALLDATHD